MSTLNEEIVEFLKDAPVETGAREKLIARARVRVDRKLIEDIYASMDAVYKEAAKTDPVGAKAIREIEDDLAKGLEEDRKEYEAEVKAAEKDMTAALRQAAQEIDKINLEEVKKEIKG